MASILEEQLREASAVGDIEAVLALSAQNININAKNIVNGWTALHWAAKRGHEEVVRILLDHGADPKTENNRGEMPAQICPNPAISALLGGGGATPSPDDAAAKFMPNYMRNPPLNGQVDIGRLRTKHPDFPAMPTTMLPTTQNDDLVLSIRVAGSVDPDFIEIEVPRWKLTYLNLLKICCDELQVAETQVERLRKLPSTRLRKDSDVKRLRDFQCLELVLKAPLNGDKANNCYQSITTCKNQTILY